LSNDKTGGDDDENTNAVDTDIRKTRKVHDDDTRAHMSKNFLSDDNNTEIADEWAEPDLEVDSISDTTSGKEGSWSQHEDDLLRVAVNPSTDESEIDMNFGTFDSDPIG
jgi:hypothetical protein